MTILKSTGAAWQCTFDDEFAGSTLDTTKWVVQQTALSGFTGGGTECYLNSTNNVWVANGYLNLTARREPAPFTCQSPFGNFSTQYTGGMASTYGLFNQTYGRFEVRAKFPAATVQGLQTALWLYPQKLTYGSWPRSGEIDIAEFYSKYPDRAIPYIHYSTMNDPNVTNNNCMISNVAQFHNYTVEWTANAITITYDGKTCLVNSNWAPAWPMAKPQPFDQPFFLALTQALGMGGNAVVPATPLPATTQVDYARIWK